MAQVYELALRKAAKGILLDDALVVYAARLRALDIRRRFAKGGQPRRDALHPANFTDGRVEILHLDGLIGPDGEWPSDGDGGLQAAWAAASSVDPGEQLAAAVDLDAWLGMLNEGDRRLLGGRLAGFSLEELARATGRSTSGVFSRLRALGHELSRRAHIRVQASTRKPRCTETAPVC